MKKNSYNIAVIPGDGIGPEVVSQAIRVLDLVAEYFSININFDQFEFSSCDYYLKHGKMLPDN